MATGYPALCARRWLCSPGPWDLFRLAEPRSLSRRPRQPHKAEEQEREAWGFGSHVALVRIDRDTGETTIEKLVLVDDCGVIINPMIVEGQIHGGVAQGLGEAFLEHMLYGDDGEVLTGTLVNYAVPHATSMPTLTLGETVTPNPFHPFGVKGVGEAGTNGAPPCIANAVMDALAPLGIDHIDMPYTAPKLWAAIQAAGKK